MPVEHSFNYTTSAGKEYISFQDWVKTLSAAEQTAYVAVAAGQQALEAQQIADGDLVTVELGKKVYSDAAVAKARLGEFSYVTPEFKTWYERYQDESGVTLDRSVGNI